MTEEEKAKLPEAFRNRWKKNSERTKDEQREFAQKGGNKSAEVRRERRAIQDICQEIDDMPLDSKSIKQIAEQLGAPEEWVAQMTHRTAKAFSVNRRIIAKGDVREWVEWLKVTGEYVETIKHEGLPNQNGDLMLAPKKEDKA